MVPAPVSLRTRPPAVPRVLGLPEPWFFLAVGALTAPLFLAAPLCRSIGWFLGALVHEMGHCAADWLLGAPSVPAVSLSHQAVTVSGEVHPLLVALVALGLAAGAWRLEDPRLRWTGVGLVLLLHPLVALSGAGVCVRLLAGHLAELAFAFLALGRALTGGFTSSGAERGLYGTVGFFLLGRNVVLTVGLLASGAARSRYASSGSFGVTNDYLVVARRFLGGSIAPVALLMTLVALLVLPAALWAATRVLDRRAGLTPPARRA